MKCKQIRLHKSVACIRSQALNSTTTCHKFIDFDLSQRWNVAKINNLCFNSLSSCHTSKQCDISGQCDRCNFSHHTLLDKDVAQRGQSNTPNVKTSSSVKFSCKGNSSKLVKGKSTVAGFVSSDCQLKQKIAMLNLTALSFNGKSKTAYVAFYAAIDTGATHRLASRELAERIFGK